MSCPAHSLILRPAQAKIMGNIQFLNVFLLHLTVLLEIMKRCGFMSRALEDSIPWDCFGEPFEVVLLLHRLK